LAGRYALIVANGTYRDEKLSRLRTPTRDAEALARVLNDPQIGDFSVELVIDEPEAVLRRKIATFFADRERDDLLLLHFSCHGLKDDSGQLYFAAPDTEVAHLDATALSAEFVSRQMTRSRSRKVVALLDCCYSGAIARGLRFRGGDQVDLDDHLGGHGRVILTASSAMEYAFEGEELTGDGNPSVFTTAVVKGLETGEADRDQDHRISVDELYDYVCEQVREITPDQSPNMLSHLEGELFIARSSYVAPVEAAKLPDELRRAIDSSLAGVREGAVRELRHLLGAHDPGLAEAARQELERLAEDDSRRVAAAAARVLAGEQETAVALPAQPQAAAPPRPVPARRPTIRTERPLPGGRAPLILAMLGALLVLVGLVLAGGEEWGTVVQLSEVVSALAALAVAASAVLRRRAVWRGLIAAEPILAAFPLGVAMAAAGLDRAGGEVGGSAVVIAAGAVPLLASVLWRRPRGAPPGWIDVGVVVTASAGLVVATGLTGWGGEPWNQQVAWPLPVGIALAALIAVVSVAVSRRRGDGVWAPLAAAAGGTSFLAALAVIEWATGGADSQAAGGPWLALLAGAALAGAGVYAQLRS
jgi:hypothetical protein